MQFTRVENSPGEVCGDWFQVATARPFADAPWMVYLLTECGNFIGGGFSISDNAVPGDVATYHFYANFHGVDPILEP